MQLLTENLLALSYVIVLTVDYCLLLSVPLMYFTHLSFETNEMLAYHHFARNIYMYLLLH